MVTRDDVARRAGVSVAVVSYVINNKAVVKEATRQKVLQAIRELGYNPNLTARSLKTKRTNQIGVLFNNIGNSFETGIALGLEQKAREYGQSLIFQTFAPEEEDNLKMIFMGRTDAIIAFGQSLKTETVDHFAKVGVPLFSIMTPELRHESVPFVDIDWLAAYGKLADHLAGLGHKRIGFMGNRLREKHHDVRLRFLRRALEARGLEFRDEWLLRGTFGTLESAYDAMSNRLAEGDELPFTAIVCANDLMAIGVLSACRDRGLSVPDRLSIASSEDILMASHTSPAITTIHYPRRRIGYATVDAIVAHLKNGTPLESFAADYEIVIRQSTGRARD
ncbi:LacI family DNA-binding transcriptional regulator [Paenibacillus flagellatus]|uniref:LacI family transcriptional regulator n=1 Tax=Paenibacillus flagellatus TaxID=2211139 RepID=A0A2V5KHZ3_9BACL|nr:LacI family DNA-binding transcriptional regulator [Paenibacillus flagellatus]PYI54030.1 LacI family transcriptional regulator [Paenibacillus flagellatus]